MLALNPISSHAELQINIPVVLGFDLYECCRNGWCYQPKTENLQLEIIPSWESHLYTFSSNPVMQLFIALIQATLELLLYFVALSHFLGITALFVNSAKQCN
jgi:hypothetical protein